MGRGGDLCKFVSSDEEMPLADRQMSSSMLSNLERVMAFLQRGWVGDEDVEEEDLILDILDGEEEEEEQDLFNDDH